MVSLMQRRRAMMIAASEPTITEITIYSTGSGSARYFTPIIDATLGDAYYEIPFIDGESAFVSGITATNNAAGVKVLLYSDSAATEFVGYYWFNTATIGTSNKTDLQCPRLKFNTRAKIVPKGYYGKLYLARQASTYISNDNAFRYFNTYAKTVWVIS